MARLAIRATSDTSKRDKVTTGNKHITMVLYSGNRAMWTVTMVDGDILNIHNYSDGKVHTMRAHGCIECGREAPLGDYCELCARDIPT